MDAHTVHFYQLQRYSIDINSLDKEWYCVIQILEEKAFERSKFDGLFFC